MLLLLGHLYFLATNHSSHLLLCSLPLSPTTPAHFWFIPRASAMPSMQGSGTWAPEECSLRVCGCVCLCVCNPLCTSSPDPPRLVLVQLRHAAVLRRDSPCPESGGRPPVVACGCVCALVACLRCARCGPRAASSSAPSQAQARVGWRTCHVAHDPTADAAVTAALLVPASSLHSGTGCAPSPPRSGRRLFLFLFAVAFAAFVGPDLYRAVSMFRRLRDGWEGGSGCSVG